MNGSRGACPYSGGSGSQRAAAGGSGALGELGRSRGFRRRPAEPLPPLLSSLSGAAAAGGERPAKPLLQGRRERSAAGTCPGFSSQRRCRQPRAPRNGLFPAAEPLSAGPGSLVRLRDAAAGSTGRCRAGGVCGCGMQQQQHLARAQQKLPALPPLVAAATCPSRSTSPASLFPGASFFAPIRGLEGPRGVGVVLVSPAAGRG